MIFISYKINNNTTIYKLNYKDKMRKSLGRLRRRRTSRRNRRRTTKGGRALLNRFSRIFSKSPRVAPDPTPTTLTYEDLIDKYKKEISSVRTQLNDANTETKTKIDDKELPGNNPKQIEVSVYKDCLETIIRDATAKLDIFDNEIKNIQDDFRQKSSSVVTDAKKLDTLKREFRTRALKLHVDKFSLGLHAIKYNITGYGGSIVTLVRNLEKGEPDPFRGLERSKQPTLH